MPPAASRDACQAPAGTYWAGAAFYGVLQREGVPLTSHEELIDHLHVTLVAGVVQRCRQGAHLGGIDVGGHVGQYLNGR